MTIYEKLSAIQAELKVPKDQHNSFGNYNYRSCEDILEKVKPICKAHQTVLILSDDLANIGERYYIKAKAELIDLETGDFVDTFGFAREEQEKKGMDGSQVTGASSSYARKYALNAMFCIDDIKDSDATNTGPKNMKLDYESIVQANKLSEIIDKQQRRKQWPDSVVEGQPRPDVPLICVDCGAEVPEKVRNYSLSKWGKCYCFNCQKKYAGK